MRCEVITSDDMFFDGASMLTAMLATSPIPVVERKIYRGDCELMMTYGVGHKLRRPWFLAHSRIPRHHSVSWDLGYWDRKKAAGVARPMRLSNDADHPWRLIQDSPSSRFAQSPVTLRNESSASGPIILVGLGPKANIVLQQPATTWEREALCRIREVYPSRRVIYRPKKEDGTSIIGTEKKIGMPIEEVLRGASLVVCKHSNVAVDACIAGIPVVCEDGAARALYNNDMANPVRPTEDERYRFLRNLAWWQWRPTEAAQAWQFILQTVEGLDRAN